MIGQVRYAFGSVLLKMPRRPPMKFSLLHVRQPIEQRRTDFIVNKNASCLVGTGPEQAPPPRFIDGGNRFPGRLPRQGGSRVQIEFLAENRGRRKELDGFGGQQVQAPRRKAAARLDELTSAIANGSTHQPRGPAIKAPDSTRPRSTADAMKGLPSASFVTASIASSGSCPAIDSSNCRTAKGEKPDKRRCADAGTFRKRWSAETSSERTATSNST